jgi:hypothetical protein
MRELGVALEYEVDESACPKIRRTRLHARHIRWTCRLRSLDRDGSLHALLQATLRADINLKPGDVSVTTWMGYDPPMNVFTDAPSTSYAHNGAPALDSFQAGLRALPCRRRCGWSVGQYGHRAQLRVHPGWRCRVDGYLDANNVVTVGSPGVLAEHATDLNLAAGDARRRSNVRPRSALPGNPQPTVHDIHPNHRG